MPLSLRILVVEDNPITRRSLVVALRAAGHAVFDAGDGRSALALVAAEPLDVVVLDLVMPDMDGLELAQRIRALPHGPEIVLVALSGLADKLQEARGVSAGFAHVLFKPMEPSRLIELIAQLMPMSPPMHASAGAERTPRVMLVDDDPMQLKLQRLRLEGYGYQVRTAASAGAAMALLRDDRSDVIVSDLLMPGMDGLDFCRTVRQTASLAHLPFVLTSSTAPSIDELDQQLARSAGVSAFVPRTPSLDRVIAAVEANLAGVPVPVPTPPAESEALRAAYHTRLLQQLERQAHLNQGLAREAAVKTAHVAILTAVADVAARGLDFGEALTEVLARTLDLAGVSMGAIYIADPGGPLRCVSQLGYPIGASTHLDGFFGCAALLHDVLATGEPVTVPGPRLFQETVAAATDAAASTLVPLIAGGQRVGVLLIASAEHHFSDAWVETAKAVGVHIAQAIVSARSMDQLQVSEERYRTLFNGVPVGLYRMTLEGEILDANEALLRLLGYPTLAALRAAGFGEESVAVEHRRQWRERLQARGDVRDFDYPLRRCDGTDVWVRDNSRAVPSADGTLMYAEGSLTDITDQRRSERVLAERAQLGAFVAAVGLALTTTSDLDSALRQCAAAVTHIPGAVAGAVWTLDRLANALVLRAASGCPRDVMDAYRRIDIAAPVGTASIIGGCAMDRLPVLIQPLGDELGTTVRAWVDRDGLAAFASHPLAVGPDVVGVLALFAGAPLSDDVQQTLVMAADAVALGVKRAQADGERRRAEEALQEGFEMTQAVVNGTSDWIFVKDLDGRYRMVNDAAARVFHLEPSRMIGRRADELQLPPDARAISDPDPDAIGAGESVTREMTVGVPGEERARTVLATRVVYRDRAGRVAGTIGIGHDITEHRELEAQFRQAQKMEAVGRLAGGIAHDFNNMLSAIMGFADLLRADLPSDAPGQADVMEIGNAARRAAGLTRQLLVFSRQQLLEVAVLDLNETVTGVEPMLRRIIGEDVTLETRLRPELCRTRADPGQLEQIIMNLAVNARDAMPTGGLLTIETDEVEVGAAVAAQYSGGGVQPGHYVVLRVRDTGCGMGSETLARIFEPFFTTKEKGKGTGLGLAMAYGAVKQSGGFILVQSVVGQGSAFTIHLPSVDEAVAAPASPRAVARPKGGDETVLIVEDDEAIRRVTSAILRRQGYTVLTSGNGGDALTICATHDGAIDLILTDIVMPGLAGPDVATRASELRPSAKVLFMSGYTDDTVRYHDTLDSGAPFLQKPFNAAQLAQKVRDVLDGVADPVQVIAAHHIAVKP